MQTQDNDNGSNHNFTHLYETLTDEAAMKVKVNERVSELELVQANHSTRGANDFDAGTASRVRTCSRMEVKLAYI